MELEGPHDELVLRVGPRPRCAAPELAAAAADRLVGVGRAAAAATPAPAATARRRRAIGENAIRLSSAAVAAARARAVAAHVRERALLVRTCRGSRTGT